MDIILLILQFITLMQITTINGEIKDDRKDDMSEFLRGRQWICREYYLFARSLEELDSRFIGVFDPDEFQQGCQAALRELHGRHDEI